jgi:hypothetical protein
VQSPFLKNLVPILGMAFVIFGAVYGRAAGIPSEQRKLLPLAGSSGADAGVDADRARTSRTASGVPDVTIG